MSGPREDGRGVFEAAHFHWRRVVDCHAGVLSCRSRARVRGRKGSFLRVQGRWIRTGSLPSSRASDYADFASDLRLRFPRHLRQLDPAHGIIRDAALRGRRRCSTPGPAWRVAQLLLPRSSLIFGRSGSGTVEMLNRSRGRQSHSDIPSLRKAHVERTPNRGKGRRRHTLCARNPQASPQARSEGPDGHRPGESRSPPVPSCSPPPERYRVSAPGRDCYASTTTTRTLHDRCTCFCMSRTGTHLLGNDPHCRTLPLTVYLRAEYNQLRNKARPKQL